MRRNKGNKKSNKSAKTGELRKKVKYLEEGIK